MRTTPFDRSATLFVVANSGETGGWAKDRRQYQGEDIQHKGDRDHNQQAYAPNKTFA